MSESLLVFAKSFLKKSTGPEFLLKSLWTGGSMSAITKQLFLTRPK
jgi:hypothetical protein